MAAVALAAYRHVRRSDVDLPEVCAVQAVAHGVDDGDMEDVVIEGTVEAVPPNVVGGFEDPGDRELRCAEKTPAGGLMA